MNESLIPGGCEPEMRFFYVFLGISLKKEWISVTMYKFFLIESEMCNRSLMDRTPDSDSGNAGSIPAGCIYYGDDSTDMPAVMEYWICIDGTCTV